MFPIEIGPTLEDKLSNITTWLTLSLSSGQLELLPINRHSLK
jgi:hypothetical protein